MRRKITQLFCSWLMLMTVFFNAATPIIAVETTKGRSVEYAEPPFRAQLDSNALIFYNALTSLYEEGKMKTGTGSYDLSKSFTQEILNTYANGNSSLAKAFQSARDAFVMDHPEIFYVDFSKVTLRLGMKDNQYVLYVNNGANENYYTSSFTSQAEVDRAIAEVSEKKTQIKATINEVTMENPASVVTMIHNKLIETTEYAYPSKDNLDVANIYGALVKGVANCDGYSRAMKWILDDYDIENVLVAGVGKNALYKEDDKSVIDATMNEYHQWNYVKIEGKWYAVDVTWDDPMKTARATDSKIRTTYLLRGADMMNENHFPLGSFSEGSQEFKFPKLEDLDYGVAVSDESVELGDVSTDLKVNVSKVEFPEDLDDAGDIYKTTRYVANYKNMSYKQLAEQGLYVAVRFGMSNTDFGPWESVDAFPNDVNMDPKNLFDFTVFTKTTIQFCITDIEEPKGTELGYGDLDLSLEGNNVILTKAIDAPYYPNYTPQPFIRTSSPALSERIMPEKTHYAVEYYEELEVIDAAKEVSIKINNTVGHIDADVENVTYKNSTYKSASGKDITSTILEFDFTPDSSFQGYANEYQLEIENMRGAISKKQANPIPIVTTYTPELPCPIYAFSGGSKSAFVMSNPKLVIDEDMSENMFVDANGDELKYGNLNIALVATRTTGSEKKELDDVLGGVMTNASASSTFELNLGCGAIAAALRPGYEVSVGVPYPEGFHPEDFGDVEFRAYHFKKDHKGEWISEEIICQITPQGLMIIANSFSPFTIVAFEKGNAPASTLTAKSVNVSMESMGGTVKTIKTNDGGIGTYAVNENESRTFTVTPDEGYVIDKVVLNNIEIKVENNTSYEATFDYDTMKENNDMKVFFVSKSVVEKEKQENIVGLAPVLIPEAPKDTKPVYVNRSFNVMSSENVAVKISSVFLQDSTLTMALNSLSKDAIESFYKYNDSAYMIASGAPVLSIANAYQGSEVTYEIPVSTTSQTLTFLAYDTANKTHVKKEVPVVNNLVTVTHSNLSEFVLLDELSDVVIKTTLQKAFDDISTLVETEYTPLSWSTLQEKVKAAKSTLDNANATQKEVNDALKSLTDARTSLVKRASKEMLSTILETALSAKQSGKYTISSLKILDEAITLAKDVVNNANASEVQVSNAYKAIENALAGLKEIGDKSALVDIVNKAKALDLSLYTEESAKLLTEALANAQAVLENSDATPEQVEESRKAVQDAIEALKEKTAGNNQESSTTSGANTGDSTNILFWSTIFIGALALFKLEKMTKKKV